PDLLAGREADVDTISDLLDRPLPILGLHAASGVGKSSLLAGGLVPRRRARGLPTALETHPAEPGLAGRLIDDLLTGPSLPTELDERVEAGETEPFVELLIRAAHLAG
ncbi:MAG: hypothetical protein AAGF23_15760, partial [Acidobacteriota bacterium]